MFGEYVTEEICHNPGKQFTSETQRVDVVFDVYKSDSLKTSIWEKRG